MKRPKILTRPLLYLIIVSSIILIINMICKKIDEAKWEEDPMILHWPQVPNDISCHNLLENDALPSVDDPSFAPKSKSIFFHETSCQGGINSRQACTVESAARAHPSWEVYLLFNSPVTESILKKSCVVKLLKYSNVKVARIHAHSFSKDTEVHPIVVHALPNSLHPIEHSADIMKILALNKWGGVYLDLDQLVVKPFDNLPYNFIAKEGVDEISTGIVAFSRDGVGKEVTSDVLKEIATSYQPKVWAHNGAMAIQRVLTKRCGNVTQPHGYCKGVSIFGHDLFYPIHYSWTHTLFSAGPIAKMAEEPYTYHMWNSLTKIYPVHQNSPYANLAAKYCPKIYRMYGKAFGV